MHGARFSGAREAPEVSLLALFAGCLLACAAPPGKESGSKTERGTREVTVWVGDPDRRPVAGAGVEVLSAYRPIAAGVTDEEGRAVVEVPVDAAVQWVLALKAGVGFDYQGCDRHSADLLEAYPPAVAGSDLHDEITLTLDGAREIRIEALDETAAPATGIRLVPWQMHKAGKEDPVNLSGSRLASGVTDDAGVAVFDWVPADAGDIPGATFVVQGGEYHWPRPPLDPFSSEGDVAITAILVPKTSIRGRVVHLDGTPAPGVTVLAQGRGDTAHFGRAEGRTDQDGRYSIEVPPRQSYTLAVIDEDWTARLDGVAALTGMPVEGADLKLSRGTLITGRVSDPADGMPIAGARVYLGYETPSPLRSARPAADDLLAAYDKVCLHREVMTNEQGGFAFRVPPGRYQLCTPKGRLENSSGGTMHEPAPVVIEALGVPRRVEYEFTQRRAGAFVSARGLVKANEEPTYEYVFEPAWLVEPMSGEDGCIQCHWPSR